MKPLRGSVRGPRKAGQFECSLYAAGGTRIKAKKYSEEQIIGTRAPVVGPIGGCPRGASAAPFPNHVEVGDILVSDRQAGKMGGIVFLKFIPGE